MPEFRVTGEFTLTVHAENEEEARENTVSLLGENEAQFYQGKLSKGMMLQKVSYGNIEEVKE